MNNRGLFVVSLDFELMWGVHDVATLTEYADRLRHTREVIPQLLKLFEKYAIHATWATVGLLFANSKEEIISNIPDNKKQPSYQDRKHSNYSFLNQVGMSEDDDIYHYAVSLISQIRQTDNQEIGSHTYSHYYCMENGQTEEQFREDLRLFSNVAGKLGLPIRSIVFPRNQCNDAYLDACAETGIIAYRGMEDVFFNNNTQLSEGARRTLRFIDSYVNISGQHCYDVQELCFCESPLINIRSSCFFRPYVPKRKYLEYFKMRRIKKQMKYAAKHGKVFHIWWHPHNMGMNPNEMLSELEQLFQYAKKLNNDLGFESVNMGELAMMVEKERKKNG